MKVSSRPVYVSKPPDLPTIEEGKPLEMIENQRTRSRRMIMRQQSIVYNMRGCPIKQTKWGKLDSGLRLLEAINKHRNTQG